MAARREPGRRTLAPVVVALAFGVACLGIVNMGCNDPQAPAEPSGVGNDYLGHFDGAALVFRLDAPDGSPTGLTLVADSLDFDPQRHLLRAQVAVRNDGANPVPGPESIVVFGFVPSDVVPQNADCSTGDPSSPQPSCAFDHRGTYGDTGRLGPGERSSPVEWVLLVPSGESFAFRAQLGAPEPGPGTIAGIVFADANRDGSRDPGEPGIEGIAVHLNFGKRQASTNTDARGRYSFEVGEAGFYELTLDVPPGGAATTPLPLRIAILRRPDGSLSSFTLGDIGLARRGDGPFVRIQGLAFEDLNRNGLYDDGEPGIPGVEVSGEACGQDDIETRTDAAGQWFLLLPRCQGPWRVKGESLDDYDRTTPKTVEFRSVAPGEILIANFGYALEDDSSEYHVRGYVYHDSNRNGFRDPGEPGLSGVRVSAQGLQCERPAHASDLTDSKGRYEIDGDDIACSLPWTVVREPVAGMRATTPPEVQIDLPPASDGKYSIDFGVAPPPAERVVSVPPLGSPAASRD